MGSLRDGGAVRSAAGPLAAHLDREARAVWTGPDMWAFSRFGQALAIGDLDGDGVPEIVVASPTAGLLTLISDPLP